MFLPSQILVFPNKSLLWRYLHVAICSYLPKACSCISSSETFADKPVKSSGDVQDGGGSLTHQDGGFWIPYSSSPMRFIGELVLPSFQLCPSSANAVHCSALETVPAIRRRKNATALQGAAMVWTPKECRTDTTDLEMPYTAAPSQGYLLCSGELETRTAPKPWPAMGLVGALTVPPGSPVRGTDVANTLCDFSLLHELLKPKNILVFTLMPVVTCT